MKVSRKHIISIALSVFLTLIPVLSFATSSDNNQRNNYNEAALYEAIEPVINAYEEYYDIVGTDLVDITVTDRDNGNYDVDYYLNLKMILKADNAAELPQIQGIANALNVKLKNNSTKELISMIKSESTEKKLNESVGKISQTYDLKINPQNRSEVAVEFAKKELTNFIQSIENDYIGKVSEVNISLRSQFDANNNLIKQLYEAFDGYTDDISIVIPDTKVNMVKKGQEQVEVTILEALKNEQNLQKASISPMANSFTYYRVKARDYANKYTSNAKSHSCGLTSHNGTSIK